MFELMESRGWYVAPITDKAREFAAGDPQRLAEVAFARWLNEHGIDFDWYGDGEPDRPSHSFEVGDWSVSIVPLTEGVEHVEASAEWSMYVRILPAPVSLVTILGGAAASAHPEPIRYTQLTSAAEWLLAFPSQHRPQGVHA